MSDVAPSLPEWSGLIEGKRVSRLGSGPPVVLIHGVGMDMTAWEEVRTRLATDFDVITYDTIGHGAGIQPPGPYTIQQYAQQLKNIVLKLKAEPCLVVGFSMGGLIAEQFAISHPGDVRALVVLNSVFNRSSGERAAAMARVVAAETATEFVGLAAGLKRWFTPAFHEAHPEVVQRICAEMSANDLAAFAAAYRVFATADGELLPRIADIACPALIVTGEDDERSTVAMAEQLAARLPQGKSMTIPGQRHMTPIEVPGAVAQIIREFAITLARDLGA